MGVSLVEMRVLVWQVREKQVSVHFWICQTKMKCYFGSLFTFPRSTPNAPKCDGGATGQVRLSESQFFL